MTGRLRKRLILGAAGTVGAAFLGDTLFLRPQPSSAAAKPSGPAAPAVSPAQDPLPSVDEAIAWLTSPEPAADPPPWETLAQPFADPIEMQRAAAEAAQAAVEESEPPPAPPPAAFADLHKLTGIIWSRNAIAIVDGQRCSVGSWIDDHQVIRIQKDRVLLRGPQGTCELVLARPALP